MAVAGPASAHHSFGRFDMQKTLAITGTVKEFVWANPHSWLYLTVAKKNGDTEVWAFECSSPNMMIRWGWHAADLKPGDKITIDTHPARDGQLLGATFAIYLPGTASASLQYDLQHVGLVIEFAIAALGNGILGMVDNQPALGVALAFGALQIILCLAAMIAVLRTKPPGREPYRIYVGLIAFGLIGALSIALARTDYGLATATSSRYVVTTAPTIVGLYLLCVRVSLDAHARHPRASATRPMGPMRSGYVLVADSERPRTERLRLMGFGGLALLAALTMLSASGFADIDEYHLGSPRLGYFTSLEYYACHASSATDAQLRLFQYDPAGGEPGLDLLKVAVSELYQARLSVFSGTTCATTPPPP